MRTRRGPSSSESPAKPPLIIPRLYIDISFPRAHDSSEKPAGNRCNVRILSYVMRVSCCRVYPVRPRCAMRYNNDTHTRAKRPSSNYYRHGGIIIIIVRGGKPRLPGSVILGAFIRIYVIVNESAPSVRSCEYQSSTLTCALPSGRCP